ncbi:hypothetical protein [Tumebacillus lipolyticus]|uniref:Uncharacterized protein n=1 Tax=Tumebacillus lipolyticus TaxID=1280370 RepID=A0ABW4ZU48_9BACL
MPDFVATMTKWIVAFLIIFLLCMILVLTFFRQRKSGTSSLAAV